MADKKHEITDADIRALVAGTEIENPEGFHFGDLKLTSNADDTVTAEVLMVNADGEEVEVIANGKGSVEAIYNAVDKFFNQTVRLLSYTMDAVTDGIDSQARVSVSIENVDTGTIFNASGIDFDVLKAGAIAYVNANAFVQKKMPVKLAKPFHSVMCQLINKKGIYREATMLLAVSHYDEKLLHLLVMVLVQKLWQQA